MTASTPATTGSIWLRNMILALGIGLSAPIWAAPSQAQTLRRTPQPDGREQIRIVNPEAAISVPFSVLLTRDQADGLRMDEMVLSPRRADASSGEYASRLALLRGIEPSMQFLERVDAGFVRGIAMTEVRIHTWRSDGAVLGSMSLTIPADGDPDGSPSFPRRTSAGAGAVVSGVADSPFAAGRWIKIGVRQTGIHALTAAQAAGGGLSLAGAASDRIRMFGRPGTELPERNDLPRVPLTELAILVEDGGDGTFDSSDRILFYAEGPSHLTRSLSGDLEHELHDYADTTYVFLTLSESDAAPLRIGSAPSGEPSRIVERLRQLRWIEQDLTKVEDKIRSGREWLGQGFSLSAASRNQAILSFDHPDLAAGTIARADVRFVGRSTQSLSMAFDVNGVSIGSASASPIFSYTSEEGRAGSSARFMADFTLPGPGTLTLSGSLNASESGSEAFIDWARIEFEAGLVANDNALHHFGPADGSREAMTDYRVRGFAATPVVWEVSNPLAPAAVSVRQIGAGVWGYVAGSSPMNEFRAQSIFLEPASIRPLPAQNLRGGGIWPDYVIITDDALIEQAREWADYRAAYNGFRTLVVTQTQILNEFSAGAMDPTAIRDFLKHLYDGAISNGAAPLRHVLMFGDTSFDTRGILKANRRNLVMTYQSVESLNRINSFASDDYFGLLDDGEGDWPSTSSAQRLDIGIGRWPVQTAAEARAIMDKTRRYEQPASLGGWRTRFTFLADDDFPEEELNRDLHALNADGTAEIIDLGSEGVKIDKIYMLSYPVENTGAGRRVPQATQAMIRAFNEGSLVMNYSGHGNQFVLADERLFTPDILPELTAADRPSIFVTATCQFGRYDDTDAQSGAEQILLIARGGAVASFTTTRVVFTSSTPGSNNYGLNIQLTRKMFERNSEGMPLLLGDIYRLTKNTSEGAGFNARKFILLGDPAIRFGLPRHEVVVEQINDLDLAAHPDSVLDLRALDELRVRGGIRSRDGGTPAAFDGELTLQVYDARRPVQLPERGWVRDGRCYLEGCAYEVETDLLFSGRVSVRDGRFDTRLVIPRDVRFSADAARILAYATADAAASGATDAMDGDLSDASGAAMRLRFDGVNTDIANDGKGPDMDLYLNSDEFVNGTLVGTTSTLFVTLNDQTGLNTSGTGVGHEITATIDTQPQTVLVLNDYVEANLDDYRGARIEYPLPELPEGTYALEVRAWDVFNNPSETSIHFEVADSRELRIENVAPYPNPMNTFTRFFFEHNQPGNPLDVEIRIFTLSGRPVQQLRETLITPNSYAYIEWNGRDRDHDRLANGTYLYVLRVGADTGQGRQTVQRTEKLVIIR